MNDAQPPSAPSSFGPACSWDILRLRARLLQDLRAFFEHRGFLEVNTPLLSADTVIDRHLDPLPVTLPVDPRHPNRGRRMYLQTSPELLMKRLLAAGGRAIYQITSAFRAAEHGQLHNPEFTIVEWYRRGDTMVEGIQLLDDLCDTLLRRGPARQISYAEVFHQRLGVDPHRCSTPELAGVARDALPRAESNLAAVDRDCLLDLLWAARVQPGLGRSSPTIVFDYPASQAALARIRDGDPPVAERFELFVDGVELANGYHELLDPGQLRQRNAVANRQRQRDGKPRLPEDSRLLTAMEHGLPPCCGVAIGWDRFVMMCAGEKTLQRVLPFPVDRA